MGPLWKANCAIIILQKVAVDIIYLFASKLATNLHNLSAGLMIMSVLLLSLFKAALSRLVRLLC